MVEFINTVMGRKWTHEDAGRRVLFHFIGKRPGDWVPAGDVAAFMRTYAGGATDFIAGLNYAISQGWVSFDGENIQLLSDGFAQPQELPFVVNPSTKSD